MNIYELLRFLVRCTDLQIETPQRRKELDALKENALDLIQQLEDVRAFGTIASISQGGTNVKRTYVR